jgi:hypothetical protein
MEGIQKYIGANILNVLESENAKKAYQYCVQYMHENYGDNVDYKINVTKSGTLNYH